MPSRGAAKSIAARPLGVYDSAFLEPPSPPRYQMPHASKSGPATPPRAASVPVASRLTGIEREILDFMVHYLRANTYQPSIREIGERFGIKSTKTVSEHLRSLAAKGFLERDSSRSRAVRIVGLDLSSQTVHVACYRDLAEAVNGAGSGSAPLRLALDRQLVGRKGSFMVRSPGDRLAAAGIDDGDFLVIEPVAAEELADGEIVAATLDGASGYYRLRKTSRGTSLCPLEGGGAPAPPIEASGRRLAFLGRVSALYRRVGPLPFTAALTAH